MEAEQENINMTRIRIKMQGTGRGHRENGLGLIGLKYYKGDKEEGGGGV